MRPKFNLQSLVKRKAWAWSCALAIPMLEMRRQVETWGSLDSQPNFVGEFQTNERCGKKKNGWMLFEE